MAASDNLGGQFDLSREINKQVIPKAHHEAILNAIQYHGEKGVEFMPNGIAFHKNGKHHIVPSAFTELRLAAGASPDTSQFDAVVPNESHQHVYATDHVGDWSNEIKAPLGAVGIKRSGLTHTRWGADSWAPVPNYKNRKSWDEEPEYFDQAEHRTETDPSKMRDYLRHHSHVGDPNSPSSDSSNYILTNILSSGDRKPDARVRVSIYDKSASGSRPGQMVHYYHYHPGTGAITRREPDHLG